jgi:hypothetical protein
MFFMRIRIVPKIDKLRYKVEPQNFHFLRDTLQFTAIEHKNVKVIDKFQIVCNLLQFLNLTLSPKRTRLFLVPSKTLTKYIQKPRKFPKDAEPLRTVPIPVVTYFFR